MHGYKNKYVNGYAGRITTYKKKIRSHVSNSDSVYDFCESFKCLANYAGNTR